MTANEATFQERRLPTPVAGSVRDLLNTKNIRDRFAQVLGARAGQFIASLANLVYASPQLRACEPMTVIAAALQAAAFNLPLDPGLGLAYLIPYGNQARFQPGYKTYIQLAHRTGQYAKLHVTEVYVGEYSGENRLTGDIVWGERAGDEITGYAAYLRLTNGFEKSIYWPLEKILEHAKRYSKMFARQDSAWHTNRDGMARKTVLKALLAKWGPLSVELQNVLVADTPPNEPTNGNDISQEQRRSDRAALWGEPEAGDDSDGSDREAAAVAQPPVETDASTDKPDPPTKFKPAVLKGKINAHFEELCTEFANHFPAYRQANGIPDRMHILAALAAEGFAQVTAENIEPAFEAISLRARTKAGEAL